MSQTIAVLLLLLFSSPSRYLSVDVDIDWNGSVKTTTVSYRALAGSDGRFLRVSRDYDPDYMEVELLNAEYGFDGERRPIPEWALDTLTGSRGWPRALVAAFPGLRPGMTLEWTFQITDRGRFARDGLYYVYIADSEPDSITVSSVNAPGLRAAHTGFTESSSRNRRVFTSHGEGYRELWLSTADDWSHVADLLLGPSTASAAETPPDLREAAIQAGAAGALPRMRVSRGRVLLTESMTLSPFPGGDAAFDVRPVQEILDTRRATPMEAASLLSAMCRVMRIEAPVVPATDIRPLLPSPIGFFRAFIMVDGVLEEPSEYLSPAGWVDTPDTLWLLLPGGVLAEMPPSPEHETCFETWDISPSEGMFTLLVRTSGGFDRELRRKLAGMSHEDMLLTISDWFRTSRVFFYPLNVSTSDLFDLTEPACVTVNGMFQPEEGRWIEAAPALLWNRTGTVKREYTGLERTSGTVSR